MHPMTNNLCIFAILVMGVPAFAAEIEISASHAGDGVIAIGYEVTGVMRGLWRLL